MYKNKIWILITLLIFCICLGSVSASDNSNSTDNLTATNVEMENLNDVDTIDSNDKLSISEESSSQVLSLKEGSSQDVLSSAASVSNGHTYHKNGYTFKVSSSQYKQIKDAIKMGKKQDWLDNGFIFKVKTNKVIKVKVLVKTKTYTKKVRYEGLTKYPYKGIKLANLKKYYKKGWKKKSVGYETAKKSKKYLGYNYVILKKTVKKYKTVKMRVYATIKYEGWSKYYGGPHYYYPWVDFNAMKKGYSSKYLSMAEFR